MPGPSRETHSDIASDVLRGLDHEQRAVAMRERVPDLNVFLDGRGAPGQRPGPERTRRLAQSLFEAIANATPAVADEAGTLAARIVTDALLRSEADRDQNVYMGLLFTRTLTRAVPDVIFQPISLAEVVAAFRWAHAERVPLTLRGAGSTAMGGSVPNDGGVMLDLSRLDSIDVDAAAGVCVIGAGARLRAVHERLAARGLALCAYPSNVGGTFTGWFVTGGIGLNAFGRGRALDCVLAADVVLPDGEHVRLHHDGRLDVTGESGHRLTLAAAEAAAWFESRDLRPITLADLAGSEGVFGLVAHVAVAVEPLPEIGAFLLGFTSVAAALEAAAWVAREAGVTFPAPLNLKLFTGSHLHHVRQVWRDEESRAWRAAPSELSAGAASPWRAVAGAKAMGAPIEPDPPHAGCLFVDFADWAGARTFARALVACPGSPRAFDEESQRFARERFRPQQTKRLGPGLIAAEIVLPADRVGAFLASADQLARNAGAALDPEVYFLADGTALVIAGYLADHRTAAFAVDLSLAPVLLDLAMGRFGGRPYVLGRWQAAYFERRFGAAAGRVRDARRACDPAEIVNRGVLTGLRLRGALGRLVAATFVPGIATLRRIYGSPATAWLARLARVVLRPLPGPAVRRGGRAALGARYQAAAPVAASGRGANGEEASVLLAIAPSATNGSAGAAGGSSAGSPARPPADPTDRALHCVNCGECNAVCPIFHESKIRLPQMLTHLGEAVRGGAAIPESGGVLLDLCMRCGNCEEVCQAGIPHLPLYEAMQRAADEERPRDRERHVAILAAVRSSARYRDGFLGVRSGVYLRRSPASLPGLTRFVVLRSENDAGPASTCIHCGACVPVCPTEANREFEGADPRWITTVQERCIGCGTCVEICPANLANGGRTLRVMEAPAPDWFLAVEEFEQSLQSEPDATED